MINSIIDGISIKLNEAFGDEYVIYSENIRQGFEEPCFFISLLKSTKTQLVGQRYEREHYFDIQYFPSDDFNKNQEMNAVAEQLLDAMEYIRVDGNLVRGTDMRPDVEDDVLHFFVRFNFIVRKVTAVAETMDMIATHNIEVEG